ncbi:uncharacterized protein LOC110445984 isoform X2 [Mizuhopecten yessoensis]|uniref:uncharacterized protein LOC110445984 isoform X2 n=1 Tax=Mizuhopecten yessoensis TaxID=6573 RepID=UPI000B45AFD8|nr:uncharacterized protein LOC110445984 isoform X2 [Mizuhopecten yessoensis]
MATELAEHATGKVPCVSDDHDKLSSVDLSKEEVIKLEQPSGEKSSSDISESSDGATSDSSDVNSSTSSEVVSPRHSLKTFTGSSGKTYKFKRTLDDSGIDVDLPSSLLAKQPRVHLGERIAISGDGHMYSVQTGSKHTPKSSKVKEKKKKHKSNKTVMEAYFPCRRVKREASLNAAARVNIMYEKDVSPPKASRKPSTASAGSNTARKPNVTTKKGSPKKVAKDGDKNYKSKGKVESGKSKEKIKSTVKKLKVDKVVKHRKVTNKGTSPKSTKTKSIVSKYKRLNQVNTSCDRSLTKTAKNKKADDKQPRKRKLSDKDQTKSKTKKMKTDTQRAARTDLSAAPKQRYSGVQCMGCYQQAMCSSTGKLYWGKSDFSESKEGEILSEETGCHLDSTTPTYTSVPPHVQIVEGSPYVNTVVPHQTLPACPRCAQRSGLITTPPCQSYTLGGIGSISSVQVVSYPQHFGSSFPISYPTSHSALPHCGCPACYTASGIYYPPTTTPMPHQPVPHDTCHGPPIPKHVTDSEESKSDVDIDVGEPEDIKPVLSSLAHNCKDPTSEKSKRKTSVSSMKGGSQKKSVEKKVALQIPKSKKSAEKVYERQKSKEVKKKPKYNKSISRHGWEFDGEPERKKVMSLWLGMSVETNCYQAIRHVDGDVIRVRECVLLCSGPKKTDIPYVAKVTNFWEHPHDGEMMMSLLWYYQPEHTESGRKPYHADCEVFASKHKDENSVACIDDKGYVLTFAEYCRYRADLQRQENGISPQPKVVPSPEDEYARSGKLPPQGCDPNNVYLCRQVYDFKLKRILKNPS